MSAYLDFAGRNWELFLLLFVIIGLLVWDIVRRQMSGVKGVTALQLPQLTRDPTVLIDISDAGEFKKGHIPNAINIPLKKISEDKSLEKHKNKNVVVICRAGNRSVSAGRLLMKNGFEKVFTLTGGMIAWNKEKLPLEKG